MKNIVFLKYTKDILIITVDFSINSNVTLTIANSWYLLQRFTAISCPTNVWLFGYLSCKAMEDYRRRPDGTVHHTTDSGNYPSVEQPGYMKRYTCTTSQKTLDQNNVNPEKMLTFQYWILHINTQQHFIFFSHYNDKFGLLFIHFRFNSNW